MRTIKVILGVLLQCIGLIICAPGAILLVVGGWFTDLGDTLRLN